MSETSQAIIRQMTDMEFYPEIADIQKTNLNHYNQFPMTDILALGMSLWRLCRTLFLKLFLRTR